MKKKLKSVSVGLFCVIFIDTLSRVILTVYIGSDFSPFSYTIYPEFWPYLVGLIDLFAAFFGAMMVITLSGKKWVPFILYLVVLSLWRISPLLLMPSEPQWIVITSTVLSLAAAFGSRQFIVEKREPEPEDPEDPNV